MITAKLTTRPVLKAVVTKPYQGKGYADGYADGMEKGYTEGEQTAKAEAEAANAVILADCNEVLPTKGASTAETLEQVPARIGEIENEGAETWKYVSILNYMFRDAVMPTDHDLVVNVPNLLTTVDINSMISGTKNIRKLTLKCGREDAVLRSYFAFGSCTAIKEIDLSQFGKTDVVKITKADYLFYGDAYLERVYGKLDFSACSTLSYVFSGCPRMKDFEVVPNSIRVSFPVNACPDLSDATIQSIIDGLADLTGATAQTLTFHATVGNKLTEAQKATITAKNWTLVY